MAYPHGFANHATTHEEGQPWTITEGTFGGLGVVVCRCPSGSPGGSYRCIVRSVRCFKWQHLPRGRGVVFQIHLRCVNVMWLDFRQPWSRLQAGSPGFLLGCLLTRFYRAVLGKSIGCGEGIQAAQLGWIDNLDKMVEPCKICMCQGG